MPANYIAFISLGDEDLEFEVKLTSPGYAQTLDDPGCPPEFETEAVRLFSAEFPDTIALAIALTPLEVSYKETIAYSKWAGDGYREREITRHVARFERVLRKRFAIIDKLDKLEDRAIVEAGENYDE